MLRERQTRTDHGNTRQNNGINGTGQNKRINEVVETTSPTCTTFRKSQRKVVEPTDKVSFTKNHKATRAGGWE